MTIEAIASAVWNNVYDGLKGAVSNPAMSLEQLTDEVVAERNNIAKEYLLKGVMTLQELYNAVNCVEVNCDFMSKCCDLPVGKKALHFEIPPVLLMNGISTIQFVGSIDRQEQYSVYTFVKYISVIAIFLDPRKLLEFDCCNDPEAITECGIISNDIIHRLTEKKIRYYRQLMLPSQPNTQTPL